jgi:hypothetical protein
VCSEQGAAADARPACYRRWRPTADSCDGDVPGKLILQAS